MVLKVVLWYVNRVKDIIIVIDLEKYIREVNGKVVEDWCKINRDLKIFEKSFKGKILLLEEVKKVLFLSLSLF